MTAVTIADMAEIVHRHELVPVPLDLEVETLSPSLELLESKITSRTRAIVVAHIFGTRIPMGPIIDLATKHGLMVIEDCAQDYSGRGYLGTPECAASLFSFGPIKTATALGGAVVRVSDETLLAAMQQIHQSYCLQSQKIFTQRIAKYALMKLASSATLFAPLVLVLHGMRIDPDRFINSLARNFPKRDILVSIRQRPCSSLVALLRRRLSSYPESRIERRKQLGNLLANSLPDELVIPGRNSHYQSYWLFPIVADQPAQLIDRLQRAGFDATQRHNLTVIRAPEHTQDCNAPNMELMFRDLIFLPIYPELTEKAVRTLAAVVRDEMASRTYTKKELISDFQR